jgi:hypothetical protein
VSNPTRFGDSKVISSGHDSAPTTVMRGSDVDSTQHRACSGAKERVMVTTSVCGGAAGEHRDVHRRQCTSYLAAAVKGQGKGSEGPTRHLT